MYICVQCTGLGGNTDFNKHIAFIIILVVCLGKRGLQINVACSFILPVKAYMLETAEKSLP